MMLTPSAGYSSSRVGTPSPPSVGRSSNEYPQFHRSPSVSDFQIEHVPKSSVIRRSIPPAEPGFDQALAFRDSVSRLLSARSRPFSVCGRIPLDSSQLVLFFRSKVGFFVVDNNDHLTQVYNAFNRVELRIPWISPSMSITTRLQPSMCSSQPVDLTKPLNSMITQIVNLFSTLPTFL
jgi:hypothetical protein